MDAKIDFKTLSRELGSESGESVILNNALTFSPLFEGPGNRRQIEKDLSKIASKFKETLGIDFGWILGGFGRPSWRQNRIKCRRKIN